MKTMALAISSGIPMRLVGMCASRKFALFSFVCAKRLNIPVSVGPGPAMLTRTPVPARFDGHRLRDAFDRVLAADIHCCGRAADLAVRRRDVDDAAFALPKHYSNLVLHASKHTHHILVENGLIALGCYIGSRTGSADGARVIDGNIEA